MNHNVLATSVVLGLFTLGSGMAMSAACSPSTPPVDGGTDAPVCNPDSGDPAGCACDPTMYKTAACYTGPPGTQGIGVCQTGKRSCNPDGTLTACVGEVTPSPEVCNYADDDCDGIVDDVQSIVEAGTLFNCNSPACSPDFPDAAITCWGPDLGICGAGVKACQGTPKGGAPTGCKEFVQAGVPEVCNGIDDDCNGQIDDGLTMEGPCTVDAGTTWAASDPDADLSLLGKLPDGSAPKTVLGECTNGNLTCVDTGCNDHFCTGSGDQCFPSIPTTEVCDGKDNDCNGLIDDHACKGSSGSPWCCTYTTCPTCGAFCDPSGLGDGGVGQFYNCHFAN
jgi:hypothetical protein